MSRISKHLRLVFLFLLFGLTLTATAQEPSTSWEETWHELMMNDEGEEETTDEETYELLSQLAEQPIDLNRATRDDLERLPFLSAQQVMDLKEYLDRYGPMRSLSELRMVRTLDYRQLSLLPYFVFVGEVEDTVRFPKLSTIAQHGKHELTLSGRVPFYQRKGDRNGYLGYRYRHWLRYQFNYGDYVKVGLLGAQDAGEPFFAHRNTTGYDVYSYYLQIAKLGVIDQLIVGKYKVSAGMGLVLNNSFSLGKQVMLQNLGRTQNTLRVHQSRSVADYFQGAAATLHFWKPLRLTIFASYRPLDATLNDNGTAATIVTSGYHRTLTEMDKKDNTRQTTFGTHLDLRHQGMHVGATVVTTHLNRTLQPKTSSVYRQFYPAGDDFLNASLDYGITRYHLAFNGETAIDENGHFATIHALSFQPAGSVSVVALHRFYSYRYATLHGHAFSEGGRVQNENGFYMGASWQPWSRLTLSGYADFVSFAWPRYRVSQPSTARDFLAEACWQPSRRLTLKGRYRLRQRQLDESGTKQLIRNNEHRGRLTLSYQPSAAWSSRTQVDLVRVAQQQIEHGYMLSQRVDWKGRWLQLGAMAAWFDTQSYASRVYAYERQLPHEYAFPMFYGRGYRLALTARADISPSWQLNMKVGHTHYNDRSVIGSGLQEIAGSSMTDLDMQVRWRF